MPYWKRMMLKHRLMEQATGDGGDPGGGGGEPADKTLQKKEEEPVDQAKLSDEAAKLLKENMQKKEALKRAETEISALKEKLAPFDGLNAAEIKKLLQERKDEETRRMEEKGEWDRLKQSMKTDHDTVVAGKDQEIESLRAEVGKRDALVNELTIGQAFTGSEFIRTVTTLTPAKAKVIYGEHFDLVDGKIVGYDKPRGAAQRTPLIDASGEPLGFEEAIKRVHNSDPEKDHYTRSSIKPGAGSDSRQIKPQGKKADADETDGLTKIAAGVAGLLKPVTA